jgi:hypothetical protein
LHSLVFLPAAAGGESPNGFLFQFHLPAAAGGEFPNGFSFLFYFKKLF